MLRLTKYAENYTFGNTNEVKVGYFLDKILEKRMIERAVGLGCPSCPCLFEYLPIHHMTLKSFAHSNDLRVGPPF